MQSVSSSYVKLPYLQNKVELQESQLTELHCIVAELKKQLRVNQDARIEEEEEDETSCEDNDDYFEDGIGKCFD